MAVEIHVFAGCGCVAVHERQAGDDLIVEAPGSWHACPGHEIPLEVAERSNDLFASAYWVEHEPFQDWALAILAEWGGA